MTRITHRAGRSISPGSSLTIALDVTGSIGPI
jgi:hypothetical protein